MLMTGSDSIDAERAFTRSARARRRAALVRRLGRGAGGASRLAVYDERQAVRARAERGIREIPLCAIRGTVEPSRASMFDSAFRPAPAARLRWQRVWLAEHRGQVLPPISVTRVGDAYVVRDGHHRVSVARARGAATIDATLA
ncbi:MAG: hypothetical protein QOH72_3279 [Solirubrobacteraceae bacterium]|jgi:hypothetical protein|nr:hypothetical protein [Solirubrobacteraceae bacterium]